MKQEYRGDGTTTKQLKEAAKNAVYIVPSYPAMQYTQELARKLMREDLKIVSYGWIEKRYWVGLELSGIVLDHAFTPDKYQYELLKEAMTRIRN